MTTAETTGQPHRCFCANYPPHMVGAPITAASGGVYEAHQYDAGKEPNETWSAVFVTDGGQPVRCIGDVLPALDGRWYAFIPEGISVGLYATTDAAVAALVDWNETAAARRLLADIAAVNP